LPAVRDFPLRYGIARDGLVIGCTVSMMQDTSFMKRLRALAALLGCLAVVAAVLPTVALAWAPAAASMTDQTAVDGLCSQKCPSCESAPCPPEATRCTVACVAVTPALGVAAFVLPSPLGDVSAWPHRLGPLHGLAPPPDPLPPRL
jgi:hypothetical protein